MIQRVMPDLMGLKNILVINDEAHHCYREKPADADEEELRGEEKKEAEKNNEAARLWISGLEAVNRKLGLTRVIDLSATPFFLRGSGYAEGTLFPWTMSDFSLMDAIECGIVKLPRVPVAENIPGDEMPMFRNLWENIRKDMPKKGRGNSEELNLDGEAPLICVVGANGTGKSHLLELIAACAHIYHGESLLVFATNHQFMLDSALWRRFDSIVPFGLPEEQDRLLMFRIFFRSFGHTDEQLRTLAQATRGASGSDVEWVAIEIIRRLLLDGQRQVEKRDLDEALSSYRVRMDTLSEMRRYAGGTPAEQRKEREE